MKKKETILKAATYLFSIKGFKETHMSEISAITGAAEGTIFYHFKNKEELYLTILKKFKESIISEFESCKTGKKFDTGLDMVEDIIKFYLHFDGPMEESFLLLHRHEAYELAQTNPKCRELLETIYNCFIDLFEHAIVIGQEDGSIGDGPSKKMAMIIFAMVDALMRFNTFGLYDAKSLYNELIVACKKILIKN